MQQARYETGPGLWKSVWAVDYDPGLHGDHLRCGDARCSAQVKFKASHGSHGSTEVAAHFFSLDRDAHIQNCSFVREEPHLHPHSLSENDAIKQGAPIVMNLNFVIGDPRYGHMGPVLGLDRLDTRYNRLRAQPHASLSVRSLKDYFTAQARISRKSLEAVEAVRVAHCQDYRPHENFAILDSREKRAALFNSMAARSYTATLPPIHDFPRLMTFRPTLENLADLKPSAFQIFAARPVCLQSEHRAALLLLDVIQFREAGLRDQFLEMDRQDVIARPMVMPKNIAQARHQFHRGRTGYVLMFWEVSSPGQFQPSPGAVRLQIGRQQTLDFSSPAPTTAQ